MNIIQRTEILHYSIVVGKPFAQDVIHSTGGVLLRVQCEQDIVHAHTYMAVTVRVEGVMVSG